MAENSLRERLQDKDVTLGSILCGERFTRGKTREDVERDIRLRKDIVEALENNDLSKIPHREFLVGYVRNYGRYLGLDENELVEVFKEVHGLGASGGASLSTSKKSNAQQGLVGTKFLLRERKKTPVQRIVSALGAVGVILPLVLVVAVLGGGLYGAFIFLQKFQTLEVTPTEVKPQQRADNAMSIATDTDLLLAQTDPVVFPEIDYEGLYERQALETPVVTPRAGRIADLAIPTGEASTPVSFRDDPDVVESDTPNTIGADVVSEPVVSVGPTIPVIELLPADESWVLVTNQNGDEIFQGLLQPGQVYKVPEDESLAVLRRAGNATQLYLRINGEVFGPIGQNGESVVSNIPLESATAAENFEAVDDKDIERVLSVENAYIASAEPSAE